MSQANNTAPPAISRDTLAPGVQVFTLPRACCKEYYITATPTADADSPRAVLAQAARAVRDLGANVICQDVLGLPSREGADLAELRAAFGEVDWPVTWLTDGADTGLFGTHLWAASPECDLERVRSGDRVLATRFEDAYARYVRMGGLGPASDGGTREEQAREVLETMQAGLEAVGMDFYSDVLRTWFYNHDILDWYGEFNQVRNQFFTEKNVYCGMVPASTGIGGANPRRTALVAGLLAVKAKTGGEEVKAYPVPSPLQCPAVDYGSSFSRAIEFEAPDHRRVLVSGTASIEPGGETLHLGDVAKQIDLTIRVAGAILESRGMDWHNVVRAIAYFRNAEDAPAQDDYCAANGLEDVPFVVTNNVVCRDDLLYEIEVDAVKPRG